MSRKQKKTLVRILISGALFAGAFFIPVEGIWKLGVYLIPYFVIGWDVLWKAVRNISHGQVFDENFLMSIATIGAFCVGEYPEGVAVMLFYQVGELFQSYSVGRSRQSIAALMDIRPDYANLEKPDGSFEQVDPDEVNIGDIIIVKAGEKIPLDGVVVEGISSLNTSALTGESVPRGIKPGKEVISGCINLNGLLRVKVTKEFGESTVAKILDLVENSSSKKAKSENFGSYKFRGEWGLLDHLIVSGTLLNQSNHFFTSEEKANVCLLPFLLKDDEKYGDKEPFRTYKGMKYQGGISDHLPIYTDFELIVY